ncbi:histidine phosphatase superfamily [Zopfochytrium polystomum]|nr:histidine phosphatase superfamily [Zopfochytrium polystomum]
MVAAAAVVSLVAAASAAVAAAVAPLTHSSSRTASPSPRQPAELDGDGADPFDISCHLASKGPYPIVHTHAEPAPSPQGCHLAYVQMFTRHGSRNPSPTDISTFLSLERLVATVPESSRLPATLKNWTCPFTPADANRLAPAGELEMWRLGLRTRKRYGALLFGDGEEQYDPSAVKFRSTMTARSGMSGSAFAAGLLEGRDETTAPRDGDGDSSCPPPAPHRPVFFYTLPQPWDYELSAKHSCPLWASSRADDARPEAEKAQFQKSYIAAISRRIFDAFFSPPPSPSSSPATAAAAAADFDPKLAAVLFKACAFQVSLHRTLPPADTWCALFEPRELLLMELSDDAKHWWDYGYARGINERMGCAGVKEVVSFAKTIQQAGPDGVNVRAKFGFGHSDTIVFLANALGLFKDETPFFSNMSETLLLERRFRMANIAPMGANMAFEIHACPAATAPIARRPRSRAADRTDQVPFAEVLDSVASGDAGTAVLVRVLVNEQTVSVPGCPASANTEGFCALDDFIAAVGGEAISDCDYEDVCEVVNGGGGRRGSGEGEDDDE